MATHLLHESEGRTSAVTLACTIDEQQAFAARLRAALGPQCQILLFLNSLSPDEVRPPSESPNTRSRQSTQSIAWMQDAFACLQGPQGTELVVSTRAASAHQAVAREVAQAAALPLRQVDIDFDGGDILALHGHLLAGMNIALRNGIPLQGRHLDPHPDAWTQLEHRLTQAFGLQDIVWVGQRSIFKHSVKLPVKEHPQFQPLFHIDLFLMPAGLDPAGCPRLFLGQVHTQGLPPRDCEALQRLAAALDHLQESLQSAIPRLQIQRLPILVTPGNPTHVRSFCNGWVDTRALGGMAYLPQFDTSKLQIRDAQEHALKACRNWGLDIRWLDLDFETRSKDGGALHCMVKVLAKQPR